VESGQGKFYVDTKYGNLLNFRTIGDSHSGPYLPNYVTAVVKILWNSPFKGVSADIVSIFPGRRWKLQARDQIWYVTYADKLVYLCFNTPNIEANF
jgi:hypothetical protein